MMRNTITSCVGAAGLLLTGCAGSPIWPAPHRHAGIVPNTPPPAEVASMLGEVSAESLRRSVEGLVAFGTRHTLSGTESQSRGIGAARRWVAGEFTRFGQEGRGVGGDGLHIYLESNPVEADGRRITRPVDVVNVIAVLPGRMPEASRRYYYVLGHLDSRASDPNDSESDAPGANDDASGVAVVMELARVMAKRDFDATIVFMATTGEEQGLYGARLHVQQALSDGVDIRAALNNDTVGDPTGVDGRSARRQVRVFSEGVPLATGGDAWRTIRGQGVENDSASRQLSRFIADTARWHRTDVAPLPVSRPDRFLRGGDHTPFNEAGIAAVRFTEVHEDYTKQHQDVRTEDGVRYGDTIEHVDFDYLAGVARLNLAALAHLANAPSEPGDVRMLAADLTTDTTLRWSASPEPDVAGYEVVWRDTTSPVWQHVQDVGNVTEATIPLSKDNWFFAVRAYDRDGYRSMAVTPSAARE